MPKTRNFFFLSAVLLGLAPALMLVHPAWAGMLGPQDHWQWGLDMALALWALLAWRLNQVRLATLAVGLVASAHWCVQASQHFPLKDALNAWLLAVPAGLGLSLLPREGSLLSQRSLARLALLLLPAGLAWAVASSSPAETRMILDWRLAGPALAGLSHAAHVGLLFFALGLVLRWHPKVEAVLLALAGSVLGQLVLAWTLDWAAPAPTVAAWAWLLSHAAQALILSGALFYLYWQRVYLDELTGIGNRRALDERLAHLDGPYALAMIDIDHFKKFNDSYGHDQGDDVLRLVARHLKDGSAGRAFRYGGEEFCVLCQGEDSEKVERLMDGVREDLARRRFHIRLPKAIRRKTSAHDRGSLKAPTAQVQVTISVGVARPDKKHPEAAMVMKLADEGLYKAKESGRNNVVRMN